MATNVYTEWVEMMAQINPASILNLKPSKAALKRVQDLVTKRSMGTLSSEEEAEMAFYLYLENMFGLAQARAHQMLQAA